MRRYRIILQARTASRRLPAKVLLPIGGLPLALLCAKRLQNTGRDVVLATSDTKTDDALAHIAQRAGIRVCRGSLDDVLSRFVTCAADLADDDVVVRATADNPLPDGDFVDLLVRTFEQQDLIYLGTSSPGDGLPYGLSGEVFTVRALRDAARSAKTQPEREHVTTAVRRRDRARMLASGQIIESNHAHLRCTVDTLEDFLAMAGLFSACADPIATPWRSFLDKLPAAPGKIAASAGVIMLGTAQLGMRYGIANRSGQPSDSEAVAILDLALSGGINHFETARSYGKSEVRIGSALGRHPEVEVRVMTKIGPLSNLADDAAQADVIRCIEASVFRSCHALRRRHLDVLLFHRSADMTRWGGTAMEHLARLAEEGVVGDIGVSVYSPEEALNCIADARIRHLQVPFNLLDRRWTADEFVNAIGRRPDLQVHARSVFLQGLLTNNATIWPAEWATLGESITRQVAELRTALGRRNLSDLCMAYVRSYPWVTTLVLGVERRDQLEELLQNVCEQPLSAGEVKEVHSALPAVPERLLNPTNWS